MKLTLRLMGKVSSLTIWEAPAAPPAAQPAEVTPQQRAELFEEWEKARASTGAGTHLQTTGQRLTALEDSTSRWENAGFGFTPKET